jgi:NADH-quinone oxidoreductase subunit N
VNFYDAVSHLIVDTKGAGGACPLGIAANSSLGLFMPELVVCATIVLMLLVRTVFGRRIDPFCVAVAGAFFGLYLAFVQSPALSQRTEFFTGMLVYDSFTVFMRIVLLLFLALFTVFTRLSGIPDREDGADVYTLVFGSTLGMCLMASANHLLIVFLAVEMASVPSYALAGLMKGRRTASEAALKYAVYGAGTAGVMLYGISLIAGLTNAAHLPTIASVLAQRAPTMGGGEWMVLALGGLMFMVGLAFKLSAVPFHFWCPDVFEGATAEIDAFLSVASKAAALALLVRVAIGLAVPVPPGLQAGRVAIVQAQPRAESLAVSGTQDASCAVLASVGQGPQAQARPGVATPLQSFIAKLVALLAVITCTFGNLAAYGQTNMKRLLAYSTIAHAGYMMMAVPPLLALAQGHAAAAEEAVAGLAVYLAVYLFMNLGAFAVVAFLRNAIRSEEINDYAGLIRHAPGVSLCLILILFSLIGLPPLSGFVGKFAVFAALARGYQQTSQGYLLALLVVGGINTAISLFYYLRVAKVMTMAPDPATRGHFALPLVSLPGAFLVLITVPTAVLMFCWDFLNQFALMAAKQLLG